MRFRSGIVSVAFAYAVAATTLAGCGGLGVDIRSSGGNTANQVSITPASGTALNPYPIEIGHTALFNAHPSAGNVTNYSVDETVRWNSSNAGSVALFEGNCSTPYGNEQTQTVCAEAVGPGGATINATTSNGAVGSLQITVSI